MIGMRHASNNERLTPFMGPYSVCHFVTPVALEGLGSTIGKTKLPLSPSLVFRTFKPRHWLIKGLEKWLLSTSSVWFGVRRHQYGHLHVTVFSIHYLCSNTTSDTVAIPQEAREPPGGRLYDSAMSGSRPSSSLTGL